ncbi:hypothetical protein ACM3CZ_03495 [Edwardsiella ictaluri]
MNADLSPAWNGIATACAPAATISAPIHHCQMAMMGKIARNAVFHTTKLVKFGAIETHGCRHYKRRLFAQIH